MKAITGRAVDLVSLKKEQITHSWLISVRRRGLVNGNWRCLNIAEKALFRCGCWVARTRGRISNDELVKQVIDIVAKLSTSVRNRILRTGCQKAIIMSEIYGRSQGVFTWAPQLKEWLCDITFVWYIGVQGLSLKSTTVSSLEL